MPPRSHGKQSGKPLSSSASGPHLDTLRGLMLKQAAHGTLAAHLVLALAGAMWVFPFLAYLHFYPIPTFHGELLALVLGLGALTAWLLFAPPVTASLPATVLLPLFLAGLIGIQMTAGMLAYREDGLLGTLYLLWAAALVWLGAALRDALGLKRVVGIFAWCALVGAAASTFAGLVQYYDPSILGRFVMKRMMPSVYANLGQPNHLADQLALGLGSLVYLYAARRLPALAATVVAAPMLFVAALTASRSPWLYFSAFAVVAAWQRRSLSGAAGRRLLVGSLLLLAGLAAAQALTQLPLLQPHDNRILPMDRLFEVASGLAPRIAVWKEAWQMFAGAPWFGVGFGQFAWHHFLQVSVAPPAVIPGLYDHAHNLVLHVLAELGVTAGIAVIAAGVAWLTGVMHDRASPERWWLLALAAVAGIHSMLEYPLWYAYFLGTAALVTGLADRHRLVRPVPPIVRGALGLAVFAGWVAAAWVYLDYSRMEGISFNVFTASPAGDRMVRVRETLTEIEARSLLKPYVDMGLAGAEPLARDRLAEKLARNTRVLHFVPSKEVAYRQAVLLALDGQEEGARSQLNRAMTYYPGFRTTFNRVLRELEGTEKEAIGPLARDAEGTSNEPGTAVHPE